MVSQRADAAQQELEHLRTALMSGRGPGASAGEITAHTRDRLWQGGLPTPAALESVAEQAQRARTSPASGSSRWRGGLTGRAVGIIAATAYVGFLAGALLRKIRSRGRSAPGS